MARNIQNGEEITITTTKLIEAGRINRDGSKSDWTHHFTFRVSVQRNGTAMCAGGLRHDAPALRYDISDSAHYSEDDQMKAMEQVALNRRMHQRIMQAYNDGYKAVRPPKYEHHSAIIMDAKTKKMREVKAAPLGDDWRTAHPRGLRKRSRRCCAPDSHKSRPPPKHHKDGALRLHVRHVSRHRNT